MTLEVPLLRPDSARLIALILVAGLWVPLHPVLGAGRSSMRKTKPSPAKKSSSESPGSDKRGASTGFVYPTTKKGPVVDDYHGTKIPDPYRWLEDLDSKETAAWVAAQNKVSFGYLQSIPFRTAVRDRLKALWNYEKFGLPFEEGGQYFYNHNSGLQNQSVLFTMKGLTGTPRELLDPNTLSKDGTVALSGMALTRDGTKLAYGTSASGSDWQEWHVRDVATGKDTSDLLKWIKFSNASWTIDGSGFYYSRYAEPTKGKNKMEEANYFQKVYFHTLGTPQSQDPLIYERKDQKEWGFDASVTEAGDYLIIQVWKGTDPKNLVFYRDLSRPDAPIVELIKTFESAFTFVSNEGPVFWFKTDLDAPRARLIAIDVRQPDRKNWKELIPQAPETLEGVSLVGDRFIASYLQDAKSHVRVFDIAGRQVGQVELPGIGTAGGFGGWRKDKETFYSFTSFTTPSAVYRYDVATGKSELFRLPKVDFDPALYEVEQVFVTSKDGTRLPMFVCHKKGLVKNGMNPTSLYSYGGFNISLTPNFSLEALTWMEMGGVWAQPCLRGGGEYGEDWHQAGLKGKKQNVFDDFIASAQWLIDNKYTSSEHLGISGRSNGGLLAGACLTQRPDLFGACIPGVGVLDMLRFHKFTIGWAWSSEYGNSDKKEDFDVLLKYSPLHNLKKGTRYPATMIHTGDHDDRVVPSHSFKFAAALQEAHGGDTPAIIRIDVKAGHGAGKPTDKIIEEVADRLTFMADRLKLEPKLGR